MKKRMRAFACAAAATLAIVPFMSGCAADEAQTGGQATEGATTEQQDGATTEQQDGASGEAAEVVKYGQVMAVNGDEVTVVLGDVDQPNGNDEGSFKMGEDEITFDRTGIEITDGSGAMLDPTTLTVDTVIAMKGTGEGADFKPAVIEIDELPFEAGEQSR